MNTCFFSRTFTRLLVLPALTAVQAVSEAQALVPPASAPNAPASNASASNASASSAVFRNPLDENGPDPWLTYYKGWYYMTTTTVHDVRLRRARRIGELKDATPHVVWKGDEPSRSHDIWAPEFALLDSGRGLRWYLYYTASDGKHDSHHRLYVAESASQDPMGPYTFKAQLQTDPENAQYAIDGTVLTLPSGQMYFLWCGRPSITGQGLYISRMSNPWTLNGPRTYLPADGFGCDFVREGPAMLQRNGRIFLVYSACPADTPDYKLGMLSARQDDDLLNVGAWKQHPRTVFARVDQHGIFGPGHNSFFSSPDGREDWIVYHAKKGTANSYLDRAARVQKFAWKSDGTPDFGLPLPVDQDIPVPSGEVASASGK